MSMAVTDPHDYELGPTPPQTKGHATFETKPSTVYADGSRDTGGGYERWRSTEFRPETPRQGKEDVYVAVHRLSAVAWCFADGVTAAEIDLCGKDVHHAHPDDWSTRVEWLNVHDSPNFPDASIEVHGHGEHTSITNTERRAYAEDAKADAADDAPDPDRCGACGDAAALLAESDDWEGAVCLDCSTRLSDGAPIEVL